MAIHLVEDELLPRLLKAIAEEDARETEGIRKGMPQDRYQQAVGYLRALQWVLTQADELRKQKES